MNFKTLNDVIRLLESFDSENTNDQYSNNISGFKKWIVDNEIRNNDMVIEEPDWEGKKSGRTAESFIATLLIRLNRYAKLYSESAIYDSEFSTQEDFIYLINLKSFGEMTKTELIKRNIHEKSAGVLIINRLIKQGWVVQKDSDIDKRSKVLTITSDGLDTLDKQMEKIRNATNIISGKLSYNEKIQLINILNKLDQYHNPIYQKNIDSSILLDQVIKEYSFGEN